MRSAAAATALGITLAIAGLASCAGPQDPLQPPEPDPIATPVFASDEEALAAAEELYGRYLKISDEVGKTGWQDTSALATVVRGGALADEEQSASEFKQRGLRQVGSTSFDSLALQELLDRGAGRVAMTVYLCLDVTDADIVDRDGQVVAGEDRLDRLPLEVAIDDKDGVLKIERSDPWLGQNFC